MFVYFVFIFSGFRGFYVPLSQIIEHSHFAKQRRQQELLRGWFFSLFFVLPFSLTSHLLFPLNSYPFAEKRPPKIQPDVCERRELPQSRGVRGGSLAENALVYLKPWKLIW